VSPERRKNKKDLVSTPSGVVTIFAFQKTASSLKTVACSDTQTTTTGFAHSLCLHSSPLTQALFAQVQLTPEKQTLSMALVKRAAHNDAADVWSQAWKKIVVYVCEASGLFGEVGDQKGKEKTKDLFVKLIAHKNDVVAQSRVIKKCTGSGTWGQYFVLDVSEGNPALSVEVWAKGILKDTFLGRALIVEKPMHLEVVGSARSAFPSVGVFLRVLLWCYCESESEV
jgi:C2 domain